MSSNIRLKKVCQHCQQPFVAKTTVTKFCSDDCAKRNYKKRKRDKKISEAVLDENDRLPNVGLYDEVAISLAKRKSNQPNRELLKIGDLSDILGISERTIFRAIKCSGFPTVKVGRRLLFNKQQVMDFLNSKSEGL